jgi:Transglycosylase-like domain
MRSRFLRVLAACIGTALACLAVVGSAAGDSGGVATAPTSTGGGGGAAAGSSKSKYDRLWLDKVTGAERRWAHRTAQCESGRDPNAIGGGGQYRGAFQFTFDAWRISPKSPGGDPIDYPYRTQAVVAVMLKREMGTRPWPVCG